MTDLDPPDFQARPVAADEGMRRTINYGAFTVFSAFEPVFGVAHRRAIGYHALLRARDDAGCPVASHEVFAQAARRGDLLELGRLTESLQLSNFVALGSRDEWLFLSLHAAGLSGRTYGDALMAALKSLGLPPQRVVLELPEHASVETGRFAEVVNALRGAGFLIALDCFGAKNSNLDRVWHLRPDIVSLDRRILQRAREQSHIERVLPGLVSMLHESGQLVLMGGLATEREALIALECNVDFVQGTHFSAPITETVASQSTVELMDRLSAALRERVDARERATAARLVPYAQALHAAGKQLAAGTEPFKATARLLTLPDAARCFLLDGAGRQIGDNILPARRASRRAYRFVPLLHSEGASWERRSYFIDAIAEPGRVRLTRPYLSINEAHLCVTASVALATPEGMRVLCVDIDFEPRRD